MTVSLTAEMERIMADAKRDCLKSGVTVKYTITEVSYCEFLADYELAEDAPAHAHATTVCLRLARALSLCLCLCLCLSPLLSPLLSLSLSLKQAHAHASC